MTVDNPVPCLIICGMHRSGTSLATALLHSAGLNIGEKLYGPAPGNPYGHFENIAFHKFHVEALEAQGLSRDGWVAPDTVSVPSFMLKRAQQLIARNEASPVWGWKDPRTVLFIDFWARLIPHAKFVMVFRSPWAVIDSLLRRGDDVFEENPDFAAQMWIDYCHALLSFKQRFPERCVLFDIEDVKESASSFINTINAKFHLQLSEPDRALFDEHCLKSEEAFADERLEVGERCPEAVALWRELQPTFRLHCSRKRAAPNMVIKRSCQKPKALGVFLCYNDGDQLVDAIEHLLANDHKLLAWDHGSTDETGDILNQYRHEFVEIKHIARDSDFWNLYGTMSEHLIANYVQKYDWISWPDQDELLEGPDRSKRYYDHLVDVFNSDYDWLLFNNYLYWFTSEDDHSTASPAKRIRRYSLFPDTLPRARAWRASSTNIRWFNHNSLHGELYPHMFNIRHYQMRSHEHALRRIQHDRAGIARGEAIAYYENMSRWLERLVVSPDQLHFDDGISELNPEPIFNWRLIYGTKANQTPAENPITQAPPAWIRTKKETV